MIIDQLPEISTVQETDEIPVERGTTTYKSTLQKLPYPVTSVNNKTGAVSLAAADVGALPSDYAPSFGTRRGISLPFTTTESGFLDVLLRVEATGRAYAQFPNLDIIVDGYQVAQAYLAQIYPIGKGITIPVPTLNNIYQANYYWTPLV